MMYEITWFEIDQRAFTPGGTQRAERYHFNVKALEASAEEGWHTLSCHPQDGDNCKDIAFWINSEACSESSYVWLDGGKARMTIAEWLDHGLNFLNYMAMISQRYDGADIERMAPKYQRALLVYEAHRVSDEE